MYNDNSQINNTPTQFNQKNNCVQTINNSNKFIKQKQINLVKKLNLIDLNKSSGQENDDSEDESDVLEISPCGRWSKRREEVKQHDIPNVDNSYLAIDGEEGLEVVWNEVRISERKYLQANEIRIDKVFNRLIQLNHNNIVKIHKYWVDMENPRLIFITEYMSSNTLKLFLKKTKTNVIKMTLTAWKRWCTQILCALRYLHSQKPSIIHGNLNCDTIFISHDGLIKIGAVAPDAIHQNVKTLGLNTITNFHLLAPEIMNSNDELDYNSEFPNSTSTPNANNMFNKGYSTAIDIYAFGIVALEMAVLGIQNNFQATNKVNNVNNNNIQQLSILDLNTNSMKNPDFLSTLITRDSIKKAIDILDNDLQKDFIKKCLSKNPFERPTAKELLFHPIIFEVPSLKLICANKILNSNSTSYQHEFMQEEFSRIMKNSQKIIAEIKSLNKTQIVIKICDLSKLNTEYMEKFFEEVRNGAYPLYAFSIINKNRFHKLMKNKRNSTIHDEISFQLNNNQNSEDYFTYCKTQTQKNDHVSNFISNKFLNLNEHKNLLNKLKNEENILNNDYNQFISINDQTEYFDEDQEDGNGSQIEDYENKCENCSNQNFYDEETRKIKKIEISVHLTSNSSNFKQEIKSDYDFCSQIPELIILFKFDDQTNRKLSCKLPDQSPTMLAEELIFYGFINSSDKELVSEHIDAAIKNQNCLSTISSTTFSELSTPSKPLTCCSSNVNSTSLEFTTTASFTKPNINSSKIKIGSSIEKKEKPNFKFWS